MVLLERKASVAHHSPSAHQASQGVTAYFSVTVPVLVHSTEQDISGDSL